MYVAMLYYYGQIVRKCVCDLKKRNEIDYWWWKGQLPTVILWPFLSIFLSLFHKNEHATHSVLVRLIGIVSIVGEFRLIYFWACLNDCISIFMIVSKQRSVRLFVSVSLLLPKKSIKNVDFLWNSLQKTLLKLGNRFNCYPCDNINEANFFRKYVHSFWIYISHLIHLQADKLWLPLNNLYPC